MMRAAIISLLTLFVSGCAALDGAGVVMRWIDTAKEMVSAPFDPSPAHQALLDIPERDDAVRESLQCAERRLAVLVDLGADSHARNAAFHARRDAAAAGDALVNGRLAHAREKLFDLDRGLRRIGEWLVFNSVVTETALNVRGAGDGACPLPEIAHMKKNEIARLRGRKPTSLPGPGPVT